MRPNWLYTLMLLMVFFVPTLKAEGQDTLTTIPAQVAADTATIPSSTSSSNAKDDDFVPFLFVLASAMACFIAGFFFLGIVIAVLLTLLLIILFSVGILSTSVYIGLQKKSFKTGFKFFWITGGILTGMVFGIVGFKLITVVFALTISRTQIILTGLGLGAVAGGFVGYTVNVVILKSFKYLGNKFQFLKSK